MRLLTEYKSQITVAISNIKNAYKTVPSSEVEDYKAFWTGYRDFLVVYEQFVRTSQLKSMSMLYQSIVNAKDNGEYMRGKKEAARWVVT